MNIHINEDTFNQVKKSILVSIKIGSSLYSLNNETSDTDYLHIIATPKNWNHSLIWLHHNLQYKDTKNNTDHVFTTLQNFVKNTLKGDSTINYEVLYSDEIKNSSLAFLYDHRKDFNSFSVIRAYLGLARRDLKQYAKTNDLKKLSHALRGLWSAQMVNANEYTNNIKAKDKEIYKTIFQIKNNKFNGDLKLIRNRINDETNKLREEIKIKFEKKELNRIMNPDYLKDLDLKLKNFCNTEEYNSKIIDDIVLDNIYEILNTDISYED